jgi:tetratricopeptide (TPR) repeat protein
VFLHVANTLLLFGVLGRMTGALWRSATVAALFALHPLHVESVAWVAERKDVLSTLFWMLTLAAYQAYVQRPGVGRYLLVVLALALGLLAKPMLVTLPCVLLLLDYWPLGRWGAGLRPAPETAASAVPRRWLVLEKAPLFALALASCAVTYFAQGLAVVPFERYPLDVRVGNALLAYVGYLGKAFWPTHLAVYYPHPGSNLSAAAALGAGLLLAGITLLVLGPGRRWPYLAVGWLWYLGALVPVIGLVQVGDQALADRYTYVPLLGIFLLLTWGASDLARACRLPRPILVVAAAAALAACATLTRDQVGYWKTSLHLWVHAAQVAGQNVTTHINLGVYYYQQGLIFDAGSEFREALALAPQHAVAHANLGNVLAAQGRPEQAADEYRQAIALDPRFVPARFNLGNVLAALGRHEEALGEFHQAIALDPENAAARNHLGILLLQHSLADEALVECRRAVALDPRFAAAHFTLGSALAALGRYEEATAALQTAGALDPTDARAHSGLGNLLREDGRLEEALAEYRRAVALCDKQAEPLLLACERLKALRPRLAGLAAGRDWPADVEERLAFADVCRLPVERRYVLAVRLFTQVFQAAPALAEDFEAGNRFHAACAAVASACGWAGDGASIGDPEKPLLRQQAVSWLRADLAAWSVRAQGETPRARLAARKALGRWQRNADLAGVRDPAALAQLPEAERQAWQALWQEVEAVMARAGRPSRLRTR